jgi:ribonucleoside-diphosphate reductase alpha chain
MTREKYYWLNEDSRTFLKRGYLTEDETGESRILDIARVAEKYLSIKGYAAKFEDYMARGFYSLSSPIWSNYGKKRGLPISCFGSYIDDTVDSILYKNAEVGMMTKVGGGTSGYFGAVRGRGAAISDGGKSTGSVHFMELYDSKTKGAVHEMDEFDKMMGIVSQGNVRRGSFAAYLPIDHPDIEEFLKIRSEGNTIQDMSFGVCVSDEWMQSMKDGDKPKRKVWASVIKKRSETGYPYIFFTDTVNRNKPQVYIDLDMKIHHSNLCTEIMLPNSPFESFVCDLASMNAETFDEWKDTDAVQVLVYFLDTVMTEFIDKTENERLLQDARRFAINHRALGVGLLGWHSYLQSKMVAFESMIAHSLNIQIWKFIRKQAEIATKELAVLFGEPPILKGYGRRNTTLLAVAPNTSSSFILGQISPSIEVLNSNYFVKDLAKGKFTYKNPNFTNLLDEKGKNTSDVWHSILLKGGSVQHLDFLTQHEKDVFKTFGEVSQKEIILQAAQRQPFIDQGQSLNLQIPPDTKPKDINELLMFAWETGQIKSLYYQRSSNPSQQLARNILACASCEA